MTNDWQRAAMEDAPVVACRQVSWQLAVRDAAGALQQHAQLHPAVL
jgi:hypothetical protein